MWMDGVVERGFGVIVCSFGLKRDRNVFIRRYFCDISMIMLHLVLVDCLLPCDIYEQPSLYIHLKELGSGS